MSHPLSRVRVVPRARLRSRTRRPAAGFRLRIGRLVPLVLVLLLGGCSGFGRDVDPTLKWPVEKLYGEAKAALDAGDYETAIDYYRKLEARYPFGPYADQTQLELAYAHYRFDQYDAAIAAADRFIKLHPQHPNTPYAYYLKGLVNFNRDRGFLMRLLPGDDSHRDPGAALQSFNDFAELVRRYPESRYAEDARKRMLYLRNSLARHELNVGEYYLRRKAYVAAANRGKYVVENFPTTPAVPDALVLMARAYRALGLHDLADDALRVLRRNHPGHPALAELSRDAGGGTPGG